MFRERYRNPERYRGFAPIEAIPKVIAHNPVLEEITLLARRERDSKTLAKMELPREIAQNTERIRKELWAFRELAKIEGWWDYRIFLSSVVSLKMRSGKMESGHISMMNLSASALEVIDVSDMLRNLFGQDNGFLFGWENGTHHYLGTNIQNFGEWWIPLQRTAEHPKMTIDPKVVNDSLRRGYSVFPLLRTFPQGDSVEPWFIRTI